ncbi:MAG TPA: carboxy terminal-processing peptidase [Saprospiraceae bacterium]|nr:carboxy terminal-processing peptidase [Saprospiraceae bacterium]
MQLLPRRSGTFDLDKFLHDMKLKTSLALFSIVGLVGIALLVKYNPFDNGGPQSSPERDAALIRTITQVLTRGHFQPKDIDDTFSKSVYALYLKEVDGGKRFLTQSDIELLKPYELQLDDQTRAGTFQFFDISVQRLDASLVKTQNWYREILGKPMDFSKNDELQADGEKLKWAKDDNDLRNRWERWMKYEVLSRIIEEQDKQEKPEFKGDKKDFATLEKEQRAKVLDVYDKWFKRLQKLDHNRRLEIYLNAITNYFDPHTGYYSPREKENFDIQMSGKLEGIGARLQSDGEKTSVSEIVPGGPAWKQGVLQAKDVILKVAQGETDAESVDIMGWDIDDVVSKVRGPKDTKVTLTVQKPDGSEKVITIVRDVVIMEEGFAKSLILNESSAPTERIGYIYLPKFYADFESGKTSCAQDVAAEVEKLKKENVKGIILDLRNNGGGSLRDVVSMSGLFIEEGPIVQVKSRGRATEIMRDNDTRVQYTGPLVVMVNGFSASASEILAAAMQDYGRAVIVGASTTYGKGTVQRFFDLDNAAADNSVKPLGEMKMTIQKFYRITGKTTQLDGVVPDIVLPDFYNLLDNGESENDYPLASTTIEAVPFNQNVYRISDINQLKSNSQTRVKNDATFQKVTENAERLRKRKDESEYPLQLEKYRMWNKKQDEEADRFENLFKPIESFKIDNLAADMPNIQSDTSRVARNDSWIKERQKDVQLYETLRIMLDMIRIDGVAKH